jgi:hypothetical protein
MKRNRALFVTRRVLESGSADQGLSDLVTGWLRDYAAMGYVIFAVTDELALGPRTFETRKQLLTALRDSERHTVPVSDVVVVSSTSDPAPFWDMARRFNLALQASLFVSVRGELSGGARSAGVDRSEPCVAVGLAA